MAKMLKLAVMVGVAKGTTSVSPRVLQRRLSEAAAAHSRGEVMTVHGTETRVAAECVEKITAYDECTGMGDDGAYYAYAEDEAYGSSYGDDASAECAYLKAPGSSCVELVDDGDATCVPLFYEAVECYYSAVCGMEVTCGDEDPFASEAKTVTFYNAFPDAESEGACFFWGVSDGLAQRTARPVKYGTLLTDEITAADNALVGYGMAPRGATTCDDVEPTKSHALGLYVSDVNTYGVGVRSDGTHGPKAWRGGTVASDPVSTIFVHEAKHFDACEFAFSSSPSFGGGRSPDLGGPVPVDDGVAQDLDCMDYRETRELTVNCDGQVAVLRVDPDDVCARASQQFMAVGDKLDPVNFPLQLLLVQANDRCDYRCTYQPDARAASDQKPSLVRTLAANLAASPLLLAVLGLALGALGGALAVTRFSRRSADCDDDSTHAKLKAPLLQEAFQA